MGNDVPTRFALAGAVAATVVAIGAAVACSSYGEDDPPSPSPSITNDSSTPTDSSQLADGGDATNPAVATCDAAAYNLAACACASEGATSQCYQGVPGAKSACTTPGAQACAKSASGQGLEWSACVGGSTPKDAEACDNDLDDNCDGVIDDGCACGASGPNLCVSNGGVMFPANAYSIFTIPATPKANESFDLYVVAKDNVLNGPGLMKNAVCYGVGLVKPCASAGPMCTGWKVTRFAGLKEAAGTQTFAIYDPSGEPPCSGLKIAEQTVTVAP